MARTRILNFFGTFLIFIGATMVFPMAVALGYKEAACAEAFLIAIAIAEVPGFLLRYFNRDPLSATPIKPRESFFLVSVCWLLAAVIAEIPYVITGAIPNVIDAFFEMCSGFSTTGSSIIPNIEMIPKSLVLWRSCTQWLGGMGIIVLFMALLPSYGVNALNIASAETPGPTVSKLSARFSGTAQRLYLAYIILTAAQIIFMMLGGVNLYDSVVHSFSTMATGGFSDYADSVGHFKSGYEYWVITIFTLIAGMNFNLFFVGLSDGFKAMFRDEELRFYLKYVGLSTAIVTASLLIKHIYHNFGDALTNAAFQVVTIISTTGFATADFNLWPSLCKMVFILLMLTGACSSSTAGGMKIVRVITTLKMIRREIKLKTHNNVIYDVKLNGKKVQAETLTHIIIFMAFFITVLFSVTLLVSVDGYDITTNFSAVLTCLSNVGPGLGKVGPTHNFSIYSNFSTLVLALTMIAGRLELTTFFVLFSRHFWHPDRA